MSRRIDLQVRGLERQVKGDRMCGWRGGDFNGTRELRRQEKRLAKK